MRACAGRVCGCSFLVCQSTRPEMAEVDPAAPESSLLTSDPEFYLEAALTRVKRRRVSRLGLAAICGTFEERWLDQPLEAMS